MADSTKCHDHIVEAEKKTMMGWILHSFKTRELKPLMLYRAAVLPHLEHCCQLWCPVALGIIRKLEGGGGNPSFPSTARPTGMREMDYWQRLQKVGLYSLERRRENTTWINELSPELTGPRGSEVTLVQSERKGRSCRLPIFDRRAPAVVQSLLESSLVVNGLKIFNLRVSERN